MVKKNDFYKATGKVLRSERKKKKITLEEIAIELDTTRQNISHYEKGTRKLSLFDFINYCDAIGVSPQSTFEKCYEVGKIYTY